MKKIDSIVSPKGRLELLSKMEVDKLMQSSRNGQYDIFRLCALAVLNCGEEGQYGQELGEQFKDFSIHVVQEERGIELEVKKAPAQAFVDGEMIQGIKEHLFAVLRDIVYVNNEIYSNKQFCLQDGACITNVVFNILRNSQVLKPEQQPNLIVCWGGHSINRAEYEYTKQVGYEMGLRGLDICTGCGPGAMKGPMKGATIGHAKQRVYDGRYIGLTEPGIIAAESPNPIVNDLVILPDIEKRLEAFVRIGHAFIVFPGGVGTAEEILFILGVLLNPENKNMPMPLILTGRKENEAYFKQIDNFIAKALGEEARQLYKIIIDDPVQVAREAEAGIKQVIDYRETGKDSFYFNWSLKIEDEFQQPFEPTHENMSKLKLDRGQDLHTLAANLRKAFSGIVAGNIKEDGRQQIKKHGPFKIHGDRDIMAAMDDLLQSFVKQNRMAIVKKKYEPCYQVLPV